MIIPRKSDLKVNSGIELSSGTKGLCIVPPFLGADYAVMPDKNQLSICPAGIFFEATCHFAEHGEYLYRGMRFNLPHVRVGEKK